MALILRVGAPLYRMQCHGGHAAALVELATLAALEGTELVGPHYEHTSLLPCGRAKILADAIGEPEAGIPMADMLYTVDADTWCDAASVLALCRELALRDDWSTVGIVVPQDDGRVNAWSEEGVKLDRPANVGELVPAWAVGGAACIHNLWKHREYAKRSGTGYPWTSYAVMPTGHPGSYLGEDTYHCRMLVETFEARIWAVRLDGTRHAAFGALTESPAPARKARGGARR